MTHPKMIRLFSDDELYNLKYGATDFFKAMQTQSGIDSIYSDVRLGRMLWEPLINELDSSINKLYFSPTSLFYQLGIEYLPCDTVATRIYDRFDVYRVSSTKILTKRSIKSPAIRSAAVYGGLCYDMSLNQLQEQHHLQAKGDGNLLIKIGDIDGSRAIDSLSFRGSVGYLPGTLHEADSIGEQLMQSGIPTKMMIGYEGTEESFKALGGQNLSIIHIATHGFYIPENDVRRHDRRVVYLDNQTENISNPLNYSGLLLSGANYVLKGGKLPEGLEDGILTANEITQMDLNNTDLVVLSACQTGVGEIREDGVFGIQRGFKKSGVHSLLMSLWNVDDKGTVMMMTRFYQNLMNGYTKQKALQNAQKEMQRNGFSSFYWASFILLDGM